jgi:phospholipid transport system substrate-binding protein
MMTRDSVAIGRRDLLGLVLTALIVVMPQFPSCAETTEDAAEATTPIKRLDAALLAAMKAGRSTLFSQRFAALAPAIEETFDLDAVLAMSIGLGWPALPDVQKTQLRAAFERYSVATYAANFDSYDGQSFQLTPAVHRVGDGDVVVQTKLVATDRSATELDYVMRHGPSGWKAVDVLADGSISRVPMQRSEFSALLRSGGAPALTAALQQKVATLSGGAPA